MANDTPFSRRRLPAVDGAILELHLRALELLKTVKPRGPVGKVHRGTENASISLMLAVAGDRAGRHLERAREAMRAVVGAVDALHAERGIGHDVHQELRTRADQIVAGLEHLGKTAPDEWADLALPPRARPRPRLWLVP